MFTLGSKYSTVKSHPMAPKTWVNDFPTHPMRVTGLPFIEDPSNQPQPSAPILPGYTQMA